MLNGIDENEAFEEQLRGMAPSAHRVDRDLLMFRAGQVTGQRDRSATSSRTWQLVSLASSLVAVGLAAALIVERAASTSPPRMAQVGETTGAAAPVPKATLASGASRARRPAAPWYSRRPADEARGWAGYAALRDELLVLGIDALPRAVSAAPPGADTVPSPRSWVPRKGTDTNPRYHVPGDDAQGGLL